MAHSSLLAVDYHITGPGIDPSVAGPFTTLENILSKVIGILTIAGIIYFTFQIIFAGYAMLSSEGDPKKIENSRDRLTQGVLGLFVVMLALIFAALIARIAGIQNVFDLNIQFKKLTF